MPASFRGRALSSWVLLPAMLWMVGACGGPPAPLPVAPNHLEVAATFHSYHVPTQVGLMQAIVDIGGGQYLVADPSNIYKLSGAGATYAVTKLTPPGVPVWNPLGMSYQNGVLYVANGVGHNVLLLRLAGTKLTIVRQMTHPSLLGPASVVADADGSVTVSDYAGNAVLRFGPDGALMWRTPLSGAYGLTESGGKLYASSLETQSIIEIDASGNGSRAAGGVGVSRGRYLWPIGLAADGGRILVTDAHNGRITTLDSSLHVVDVVGGNGPGLDVFNYPFATLPIADGYLIVDTYKYRILRTDRAWTVREQVALGPGVPVGRGRPVVSGTDAHPYTYTSLPGVDLAAALGLQAREPFVGALDGLDHILSDGKTVHMDFSDPQFGATSITWAQTAGAYIVVGSSQRGALEVIDPATAMFTFVDVGGDTWWHSGTLLLSINLRRTLTAVIAPAVAAFARARQLLAQGVSRPDAYNQALAFGQPRNWSQDLSSTNGQRFLHSAMTASDASAYFQATLGQQQQSALELLEVRYLSGA